MISAKENVYSYFLMFTMVSSPSMFIVAVTYSSWYPQKKCSLLLDVNHTSPIFIFAVQYSTWSLLQNLWLFHMFILDFWCLPLVRVASSMLMFAHRCCHWSRPKQINRQLFRCSSLQLSNVHYNLGRECPFHRKGSTSPWYHRWIMWPTEKFNAILDNASSVMVQGW